MMKGWISNLDSSTNHGELKCTCLDRTLLEGGNNCRGDFDLIKNSVMRLFLF